MAKLGGGPVEEDNDGALTTVVQPAEPIDHVVISSTAASALLDSIEENQFLGVIDQASNGEKITTESAIDQQTTTADHSGQPIDQAANGDKITKSSEVDYTADDEAETEPQPSISLPATHRHNIGYPTSPDKVIPPVNYYPVGTAYSEDEDEQEEEEDISPQTAYTTDDNSDDDVNELLDAASSYIQEGLTDLKSEVHAFATQTEVVAKGIAGATIGALVFSSGAADALSYTQRVAMRYAANAAAAGKQTTSGLWDLLAVTASVQSDHCRSDELKEAELLKDAVGVSMLAGYVAKVTQPTEGETPQLQQARLLVEESNAKASDLIAKVDTRTASIKPKSP